MSGLGFTTIFSLKGGVGKTSLASALCLELDYEGQKVPVITNDAISPLEEILGKDKALELKPDQDFPELKKMMTLLLIWVVLSMKEVFLF